MRSGALVELAARAQSHAGVYGPLTPVVTITLGEYDAEIPLSLDADRVTIDPSPGGARVNFVTSADPACTHVQLYRSISSTLNRETDAKGQLLAVDPSRPYTIGTGDLTRRNLVPAAAASFADASGWVLGADWTISGGQASHASGTASEIKRSVSGLVAGKAYRIAFTRGPGPGSITPRLTDQAGWITI